MTKKEKKAKKRLKREKKMWGGMTKEELYSYAPMMHAFAATTSLNLDVAAHPEAVGVVRVHRSAGYISCPTFESTGASLWSTTDFVKTGPQVSDYVAVERKGSSITVKVNRDLIKRHIRPRTAKKLIKNVIDDRRTIQDSRIFV